MSSSVPRPKPWEVASGTSAATVAGGDNAPLTAGAAPMAGGTTTAPSAPERPTSLNAEFNNIAGTSPYGGSSYGSTGYGNSYGLSGYGSRYGGMYGSGYGGMSGGYGSSMYGSSMYGGMGGMGGYGSSMYGGMGGMGGMGGGMYGGMGQGMGAGGAGGLAEGTQATFQLIESIIGAVGGFAQMLEATYMATHSSFFTMVSLAEQFGNLKNALGSLLGIFALIKFVKKILYKVTGQTYNYGLNIKEFSKFEKSQKKLEENLKKLATKKPRISLKPLLLFIAASIGFPYLLSKAIQKINEQQQRRQPPLHPNNANNANNNQLDPANLQFAKAVYEFNPENPQMEIELKPNDLVAILSKLDPVGNESKWWKVRSRQGKVGYVPSNYLSVIERKPQKQVEPAEPEFQKPTA